MNKKIIMWAVLTMLAVIFMTLEIQLASAEVMPQVYEVRLHYLNGEIKLDSINLTYNYPQASMTLSEGEYQVKIFDYKDEESYTNNFIFGRYISSDISMCYDENNTFHRELCNGPSFKELNDTTITLNIPYQDTGKTLIIAGKEGSTLLDVDLTTYMDYCGDNICSATESYWTCSLDCRATAEDNKTLLKYDGVGSTDNAAPNRTIYIIISVAIVLVVLGWLFTRKKQGM